jgi:hypothetical protein
VLFPLGKLVPAADLVRREPIVERLVLRLESGQSVVLAGPRRTGKSSVLAEVLGRLRERGFVTAMVDCLGDSSREVLAEDLVDRVLENEAGIPAGLRAARGWLRGLAEAVSLKAKAAELDLTLELAPRSVRGPVADLGEALDFAQRFAKRRDKRAVICFDEFQTARRFGREIYGEIRSHLIRHDRVTYVFLGSRAGLLTGLFEGPAEPFYRFAWREELPAVPQAAWAEYLDRKFDSAGVAASQVLGLLLERTGGHPQDTMFLANELYLVAREYGLDAVGIAQLEQATERTMLLLGEFFRRDWEGLSSTEQVVLRALATGERPYRATGRTRGTARALEKLVELGALERRGRGNYRFFEEMFRRWVATAVR